MVNSLVDLLASAITQDLVAVCILFVYNYSLKIIFDERLKGILLILLHENSNYNLCRVS